MFTVKLLVVIALIYGTLDKSLGILLGYLPGQVYSPSSSATENLPISYNYANSCEECVCRAIMSTTWSFVAINCLTSTHLCILYTSYAANFTVKPNSTAYLYLLQPLPQSTVKKTTEIIAPETSMMEMATTMSTTVTTTTGGPCSPPTSGYIAMLTDAPSSYQLYSYAIRAEYTRTVNLNFIFQGDSTASWHLDDISLEIVSESDTELLIDGDFENSSNGWTLDCWEGCAIGSSGLLTMDTCHSGAACFVDGCTGAYDFLFQSVNITEGVVYNLSFWLYLDAGGSSDIRAYISLQ